MILMDPKDSSRFVIRAKRKRCGEHYEGWVWTCHRVGGNSSSSIEKTRDHISELPDDILCSIISLNSLSIIDRVRTTCLSSRWTRLCAFPSHLRFDWNSMFSSPPNSSKRTINNQDPCCKRLCKWQCKADKERFVQRVSQFLETYNKTTAVHHQIDTFTVDFCLGGEYATHIDQWVDFAINKGVKTLVLKLSCLEIPIVRSRALVNKGYHYTFDCSASGISNLEMKSCTLTLNAISNFSSLTSLHLTDVDLEDQKLLDAISQYCWNLKSLALYHCRLAVRSRISSKFLDTLDVHFCPTLVMSRIQISAANLTQFQYSGMVNLLSFSGVPNLRTVYLKRVDKGHDQDMHYIFTQLANDLPSGVKVLGLNLRCTPNPSALAGMVAFKVKELNLTFRLWMDKFNMLEMIHILMAFPVLHKFKLQISYPRVIEEPVGCADAVFGNTHLKYLEEVEIRGFRATQNQIDFAIYLLKFGISLKRLVINPKTKRVSWDEGEREKLCEALQHFSHEDKEVIIAP